MCIHKINGKVISFVHLSVYFQSATQKLPDLEIWASVSAIKMLETVKNCPLYELSPWRVGVIISVE